jgi:site-specific DNA recombinase
VCDNKPIRQEQLDAVVWQEIVRLLEDPSLLQAELDRRLQAAQTTDPLKRREDALRRDQARLTKSMERLLTGYQENLITLEELRCRMPELRKQQRAWPTCPQSRHGVKSWTRAPISSLSAQSCTKWQRADRHFPARPQP